MAAHQVRSGHCPVHRIRLHHGHSRDVQQENVSINAAGADIWGGGGQHDDAYGTIYQTQAATAGTTVTARVDRQDNTNGWAKAGVVLRNNLAQAGSSPGYAVMVLTPSNGVSFQWDSNGDGYLDQLSSAGVGTPAPVWVRLVRTGTQISGYYSTNGTTFTKVGPTADLSAPAATQDAGLIATSHNAGAAGTAQFSNLQITTTPFSAYSNIDADLDQHHGNQFAITGTGSDMWGSGGQHDDQYGSIYQPAALPATGAVTVRLEGQENTNPWAKAGLILPNSIPGATTATGYTMIARTPSNGITLQWDSNSDGYLDQLVKTGTGTAAPVWLRLTRNGTQVIGAYSVNGTTWTNVGTATLAPGRTPYSTPGCSPCHTPPPRPPPRSASSPSSDPRADLLGTPKAGCPGSPHPVR